MAVLYTKVHGRPCVLSWLHAINHRHPLELRRALATIDRVIANYADNARLGATA